MNQRKPLKALAFLTVPTALLLMAAPVLAEPFQGGGEGPGGHGMGKGRFQQGGGQQGQQRPGSSGRRSQMMDQLGLSAEQKQKVKALMEQGKSQSQSLSEQLKTKRQSMMQYLQSPSASEAKARAMNTEISDIQKHLSELRLKTWFGMRAILTPEQIQKLGQMKNKRPGSSMGGGQGMNGGMGGRGMEGGGGFGESGPRGGGQNGPRRGSMQPGQFGPGDEDDGYGPDSGFSPDEPGFGPPPPGTRIGYAPGIPDFQPHETSFNPIQQAPMPGEPRESAPPEFDGDMMTGPDF